MEEEIEYYIKAGSIAKKAIEFSKKIVKEGANLLDICEKIEEKILDLGGRPAFPVNISINEIAAHDTARPNEDRVIKNCDVVKVDVGVHVNGYIADTAYTIEVGSSRYKSLIEACEEALAKAIEIVKPGITVSEIGRKIEETAVNRGFTPIVNLGGHSIERFNLHSGKSIPNYDNKSSRRIEEGEVIAIEPFLTIGSGRVIETKDSEIYSLREEKPVRERKARDFVKFVLDEYKKLPFARRWVFKKFGDLNFILFDLVEMGILKNYPILKEDSRKVIVQAEHTVVVLKEPLVITR